MSKKIAEETEQKESVLTKISNFFKANKGAQAIAETVADDKDPDAKKTDNEEDMSAKKTDEYPDAAKADGEAKSEGYEEDADAKKSDSEEDDDPEDPEEDPDDSDEDEIEINGTKVNLKDPKATREAIEGLLQINAAQNELLVEASQELASKETVIDAQVTQIKKTTEQVKKEIKSQFIPPSSKRSDKIGIDHSEAVLPDGLMPKEGTIANAAVKDAVARAKAANKKV